MKIKITQDMSINWYCYIIVITLFFDKIIELIKIFSIFFNYLLFIYQSSSVCNIRSRTRSGTLSPSGGRSLGWSRGVSRSRSRGLGVRFKPIVDLIDTRKISAPHAVAKRAKYMYAPKLCICSHFVKYVESQWRSDCCEVTVAKRLFSNFVKYAEPHSRSDCTPRRGGEAAS